MKKIVFISCFGWYEDRLKYIENYYKEYGIQSIFITSDFNHIKKERIKRETNEKFIYIKVIKYRRNISILRLISHIMFVIKSIQITKQIQPYIVYALIPPNLLVYSLAKLKNKLKFKLIFDVIDLWPESMPIGKVKTTAPFKLWSSLRNKSIDKADIIVLECKHYKTYINELIDSRKVNILYLTKKHNDYFQNISNVEYDQRYITLCYLGSINNLIDIDKIIEVVEKIQSINKVKVKIIGKGERQNELINRLDSIGAIVDFYGEIYDEKFKIDTFKDCHFGLNIYKNNVSIGLTIKSIDYFQMGLPIINSIKGDTQEMIIKNNLGINVEALNEQNIRLYIENMHLTKKEVRKTFLDTFDDQNINRRLTFLNRLDEVSGGD